MPITGTGFNPMVGGIAAGTRGRVSGTAGASSYTASAPTALAGSSKSVTQGSVSPGPRVGAQAITSAAYGSPIPRAYGTIRLGGNIIWAQAIKQKANVKTLDTPGGMDDEPRDPLRPAPFGSSRPGGGSGRGSSAVGPPLTRVTAGTTDKATSGSVATTIVESYSNYATFAIAFAAGPAQSVTRMWANGELLWDKIGTKPEVKVKNLVFRFYPGTETQRADPRIVKIEGEQNTPAFRGLCYIVFQNLNLDKFDGKVPNITAEIVFTEEIARPVIRSTLLDGPLAGNFNDDKFCVDWKRGYCYYGVGGVNGGIRRVSWLAGIEDYQPLSANIITGTNKSLYNIINPGMIVAGDGSLIVTLGGTTKAPIARLNPVTLVETGRFGAAGSGSNNTDTSFLAVNHYAPVTLNTQLGTQEHYVITQGFQSLQLGALKINGGALEFLWRSNKLTSDNLQGEEIRSVTRGAIADGIGEAWVMTGDDAAGTGTSYLYRVQIEEGAFYDSDNDVTTGLTLILAAQFTPSDLVPGAINIQINNLIYDQYDDSVMINLFDGSDNYVVKYSIALGGLIWRTEALAGGPTVATVQSRCDDNRLGWVTQSDGDPYLIDTITGDILLNGPDTPGNTQFSPAPTGIGAFDSQSISLVSGIDEGATPTTGPMARYLFERGDVTSANIASIISDISAVAGYDLNDLNVSDVVPLEVAGFAVTDQTSARGAIESLTDLYLVDVTETDFQLTFKQRGDAPVETIAQANLVPLNDQNGLVIENNRVQEVELPVAYRITYFDKDNDYMQQTHSSKRIQLPFAVQTTRSTNKLGVELPIALDANTAKQRSEATLFAAWSERNNYNIALPWRYIPLDPNDVVTLDMENGEQFRTRVVEVDFGTNLRIEQALIVEEGVYTPVTLGDGGQIIQQIIGSTNAVRTVLMDIPYLGASLNVADRSANVLWVFQGPYADQTFESAIFQKQITPAAFNTVVTNVDDMLWGVCLSTMPDSSSGTIDTSTQLEIRMINGLDVLYGADSALFNSDSNVNRAGIVKQNGDVELVRFMDVTDNGDGSYILSNFIRGYRGTDATGHGPGETFVLMTTNLGERFNLPLSDVGQEITYRALGSGQQLPDGEIITYTSNFASLKPLAPVNPKTEVSGSDVIITWFRQDRLGFDLRDFTADQPLSEQSEEYDIEIYDAPGGTLLDSSNGLTSATYTYTGGATNDQLTLRIYQISQDLEAQAGSDGRGFVIEKTVGVPTMPVINS